MSRISNSSGADTGWSHQWNQPVSGARSDKSRPPETKFDGRTPTQRLADFYYAAHLQRLAQQKRQELQEQERKRQKELRQQAEQERRQAEAERQQKRQAIVLAECQIDSMCDQHGLGDATRAQVYCALDELGVWNDPTQAVERAMYLIAEFAARKRGV